MTWARILATGSGTLAIRASIEGLGYEFVSSGDMVTTVDGRPRIHGLDIDEITLEESVDPGHAEIEASGFTLRVLDDEINHYATKAFAWRPAAIRYLTADVTAAATTINMDSTSGITAGDTIHIGTEAILVDTVASSTQLTGCTRARWGTTAQAHYASDGERILAQAVYLTRPPTIEGRRITLYAYGDGDDPEGDGTAIWRGVCTTDAALDDDQSFWSLNVDPITALFEQSLGGDTETPFTPRGIYYPANAPLVIRFTDVDAPVVEAEYFFGFYRDNAELVAAINAWFATVIAGSTDMARLEAVILPDGTWTIDFTTGATNTIYALSAYSLVDSHLAIATLKDTGAHAAITHFPVTLETSTSYRLTPLRGESVAGARKVPRGIVGGDPNAYIDITRTTGTPPTLPDFATYPSRRIYLSGAGMPSTNDSMTIAFLDREESVTVSVTAIDAGDRYVDVRPFAGPSQAFASGAPHVFTPDTLPEIRTRPRLTSTILGTLKDFRDQLISLAPTLANTGRVPWFTEADLGAWSEGDKSERGFTSAGDLTVGEFLAEELKYEGLFCRILASGEIDLARLTMPSKTAVVTLDVDDGIAIDDELPTWERSALGTLNTVTYKTGYDPIEDEHTGPVYSIRNESAYAARKAPRVLEVAPYSRTPDETVQELARRFSTVLGLYGGDYAIVSFEVPLTCFGLLLGDTVRFDGTQLPDVDTGERGPGSLVGTVISRSWHLRSGRGQYRAFVSLPGYQGYAPALGINVGSSSGSGTAWTLQLMYTDPSGTIDFWTGADVLSDHFAVGDLIRVYTWDDDTPTTRLAEIDAIDDGAVQMDVTFTASWVPGSDDWVLEYREATDIEADTTAQDDYVFFGDTAAFVSFSDGDERAAVYSP